jgi:hypothetical protein
VIIWLQVRDVHAEHERLAAAGVRVLPELWIEDPDGGAASPRTGGACKYESMRG